MSITRRMQSLVEGQKETHVQWVQRAEQQLRALRDSIPEGHLPDSKKQATELKNRLDDALDSLEMLTVALDADAEEEAVAEGFSSLSKWLERKMGFEEVSVSTPYWLVVYAIPEDDPEECDWDDASDVTSWAQEYADNDGFSALSNGVFVAIGYDKSTAQLQAALKEAESRYPEYMA